jgi:hypothetical protein
VRRDTRASPLGSSASSSGCALAGRGSTPTVGRQMPGWVICSWSVMRCDTYVGAASKTGKMAWPSGKVVTMNSQRSHARHKPSRQSTTASKEVYRRRRNLDDIGALTGTVFELTPAFQHRILVRARLLRQRPNACKACGHAARGWFSRAWQPAAQTKRNSGLGGGGGNTQAAVRTKRQQTGRRGGTPSTCCLIAQ